MILKYNKRKVQYEKKIVAFLIIVIILATTVIISYLSYLKSENYLWKTTVSKYITGDLWDDINSYDAGHTLLIPMFYAFTTEDENKMEEFHNLFERYSIYLSNNNYTYNYWDLNHMQFNFLASNYINLCSKYNCTDRIKEPLLNYLYDEAFYYCLLKREKYNIEDNPNYNALTAIERDFELGKPIADLYQYHLMIIFNLKEYSNTNNYYLSEERENVVTESLNLINRIYQEGVTFIDGDKWLISVGSFDEYADYAYMHYDSIEENMEPSKQENTTWDTSHFARVPVFLQIIKKANQDDKEKVEYYNRLIKGLKEQFLENVLIEPDEENPYYRTTNYMDGRNGLYRYNYTTQKDTAYLPYQLSGTITLGWWCFLGEDMNLTYKKIYKTFPLGEKALETYVGPNTTRERNEYVSWPNYFENGFAELICLLASKLNIEGIF